MHNRGMSLSDKYSTAAKHIRYLLYRYIVDGDFELKNNPSLNPSCSTHENDGEFMEG